MEGRTENITEEIWKKQKRKKKQIIYSGPTQKTPKKKQNEWKFVYAYKREHVKAKGLVEQKLKHLWIVMSVSTLILLLTLGPTSLLRSLSLHQDLAWTRLATREINVSVASTCSLQCPVTNGQTDMRHKYFLYWKVCSVCLVSYGICFYWHSHLNAFYFSDTNVILVLQSAKFLVNTASVLKTAHRNEKEPPLINGSLNITNELRDWPLTGPFLAS
jgi:hypothetical protein